MLLTSILSVFLSLINPLLGISYLIGFGSAEVLRKPKLKWQIFLPIGVLSVLFVGLGTPIFDVGVILFSLAGLLYVFTETFKKQLDFGYTLFWCSVAIAGGALFQYVLWGDILTQYHFEKYQLSATQIEQIQSFFPETMEKLYSAEVMEAGRDIMANYYSEMTILSIGFGLLFGMRIFAHKLTKILIGPMIVLPVYSVYMMMAAMGLILFPSVQKYGIIMFVSMIPMYAAQGLDVVRYFWQPFLRYFGRWRYVLYFALIINLYTLLLVLTIGVLDSLFDFRKIRKVEESNENHSY